MLTLTQDSTAREIATTVGCSLPTVMIKAKKLGLKFKGRDATQHSALMDALTAVKPRPRKDVKNVNSKTLSDRIATHLAEGKVLIEAANEELKQLDRDASNIQTAKVVLLSKINLLAEEQGAI